MGELHVRSEQIKTILSKLKGFYPFDSLDEKAKEKVLESLNVEKQKTPFSPAGNEKALPESINLCESGKNRYIPEGESVIGYFEDASWESEAHHFVAFCTDGLRWHSKLKVWKNAMTEPVEYGFIPYSRFNLLLPRFSKGTEELVLYVKDLKSASKALCKYGFTWEFTLAQSGEQDAAECQSVFDELWETVNANYSEIKYQDIGFNVVDLMTFVGTFSLSYYCIYAKAFSRLARKNLLALVPTFKMIFGGPLLFIKRRMFVPGVIALLLTNFVQTRMQAMLVLSDASDYAAFEFLKWLVLFLCWIPCGILNPLLYYFKFRFVLKKTSHITDNARRLEVIEKEGGVRLKAVFAIIALFIISLKITGAGWLMCIILAVVAVIGVLVDGI